MPITVRDLLELPGLGLGVAAGSAGLDRSIRIVHTSELGDPTPWLSGDEFLLTTGMGAGGSPALQRAYIRRLVKARVAGLGFGLGFGFESIPAPLIKAADREGLPLLEVPYPVPFLAIAEAVASRLAEDRVREAQSSVEVHERLAFLVSDGSGPADVLDEVTAIAGGWAALFDSRGQVVAASRSTGERDLGAVWSAIPSGLVEAPDGRTAAALGPDGTLIAVAVVAAKRPEGVLVFGKEGRIHAHDRMVVHHAVTVVGLLLAYRRAIVDTERRVAGDILSEAFEGRLAGEDLERRLVLAGFPAGEPLTALVVECAEHPESLGDLLWSVDAALGARASAVRTTITPTSVTAVVAGDDPVGLARSLVAPDGALAPFALALGGCRVGVGESTAPAEVRRSYLSAQLALKAAPPTSSLATQDDLGSFAVLLRSQPRSTLEGYVRAVLGPLIDRDRARNSDLLASVRAFVEAGGRWEPGAEALSVHRHTLRYRIHQAEELLGRDLSSPRDQLEILLALKAAEILDT